MDFQRERNKGYKHFKNNKRMDASCLESTPEKMRMEIDRIFKDFLDDPNVNEYIFPSDLNNLQRKYIHYMAQKQNIISKSHGKEPNRKLHIKKKSPRLSNQYFEVLPCAIAQKHLNEFVSASMPSPETSKTPSFYNVQKVTGKLIHSPAGVPSVINITPEVVHLRQNLPVFDHRETIIETIKNNQIVVISSETGSGKTTQVPQYLVENSASLKKPCKVICTQPRRISTVAAAERVSYERGDVVGGSVGYHIKLEQNYGFNTNIIYCTTGVLLRNLMCSTDGLRNITHIIIDEIHERDKLADFLLICLKQNVKKYPNLKIILMSATINVNKFVDYFKDVKVLSIPGRLYAIDTIFLEDVLVLTKYMSPQMREAKLKEQKKRVISEESSVVEADKPVKEIEQEINPCVDEALEEYLNFSENYNYNLHYVEATAQLGMYFLSEGISVDYQHSQTGQTALMIAAYLGDKEFVSRLCSMGANLDLCCKLNKTVFDYAYDNTEILRILEYVKNKKNSDSQSTDTNKEGEFLLKLFDKTTPDDFIDYDLIITLISFIHVSKTEGSILVFLPGYDEIMLCNDRIVNSALNPTSYKIFFLHSSMNIKEQNDVFKKLPNLRKIILSTNIAETSVTIDDVVFVMDIGKAKEKCFDAYNKVSSLQTRWISQACANQRKGRAGRTRPGMCFRIYSKQRFENMDEERIPEILRVSLEELCLHAKILAAEEMNIHNFLSLAPDAPSANSIKVAIENLQFLGALDKEEDLTRLGAYLSQLTIEPQLGKMLIYGVIFRCLEPILTMVASMSHKDPFMLPPQANLKSWAAEKRKTLINGVMSDHVLYLEVFRKWQESSNAGRVSKFCQEYYISHSTMNSILETRSQLLGQLRAVKFIHQSNSLEEYNKNACCWPLVKAIICTGSYPNLAYPLPQNSLATRTEKKVNVQGNSACGNQKITTWLVYDELIKHRNGLFIRGVTAITTLTVGLVCGIEPVSPEPNILYIDEWVEFEYPDHSIIYLRNAIEFLVNRVMLTPWYAYNSFDNLVLRTLRNVLEAEEAFADLTPPFNIGDKPKFFLPQKHVAYRPGPSNWRSNEPSNNSRTFTRHNRDQNGFTHSGYSPRGFSHGNHGKYNPNSPKRNTGAIRRASNSARTLDFQDNQNSLCQSVQSLKLPIQSPADLLINALQNDITTNYWRFDGRSEDVKDNKVFLLIKPKQRKNVEIAQQTAKWIFAPQTEKKILNFKSKRKPVFLLFTVNQTSAFQGVARFIKIYSENSGKPTAVIEWLFKTDLPFINLSPRLLIKNPTSKALAHTLVLLPDHVWLDFGFGVSKPNIKELKRREATQLYIQTYGHCNEKGLKHLRNPYNGNRPIFEGVDGQIVQEQVGEELIRIYRGSDSGYCHY